MRKSLILGVSLLLCTSCSTPSVDKEMDAYIDALMGKMTLREKLGQMNLPTGGDLETGTIKNSGMSEAIRKQEVGGILNVKGVEKIYQLQRIAVEETELGIPLIVGADVVHGYETIFPIPLAMSCTWDTMLVQKAARIAATEASADGVSWTYSPMVDICKDARWGRIAEGGGEDPYLGSLISAAYIKGYQGEAMKNNDEIMACVKHFAFYGASEAGRDYNICDMSRNRMYNDYMMPYKAAVDAGVGSIMSSFNTVDGIPATANKWLLTDLLRGEWDFDGFVVTDYNSIGEMRSHGYADIKEAAVKALLAGTDMDMVTHGFLNQMEEAVNNGLVDEKDVDKACRRILEAKYKLGLFDNPYKYCDSIRAKTEIFTAENRKAAREIAAQTFVLLKNENGILPLDGKKRIALIGPMADQQNNMCGTWSMGCPTDKHVTVLQGLKTALGDKATIRYAKGSNIYFDEQTEKDATGARPIKRGDNKALLKEAMTVAQASDVIVAAVGECSEMSGESASRTQIQIPDAQRALLEQLVSLGKPVVVVLFTGRPLDLTWETTNVDAILNVWFAGCEAGDAIADVLLGKVNPSGRLTTTFPRSVGQVPIYYNSMRTGRPDDVDKHFNRFVSNYIDERTSPLYPFGYGLSYTKFEYGNMSISTEEMPMTGKLEVSVPVTNTGNLDGYETVQLYIHDLYADVVRPIKELKGFKKVFIKKGQTENVTFKITADDLKYYNSELKYVADPGEFDVMVGPNSADLQVKKFILK